MIEVIDKGYVSESHSVPLLFVHGAWHTAWYWDEYFLKSFADKGYRALAVSLRAMAVARLQAYAQLFGQNDGAHAAPY